MAVAAEKVREFDHEHCGCCGRDLPRAEVTELGSTPGVRLRHRDTASVGEVATGLWAARVRAD